MLRRTAAVLAAFLALVGPAASHDFTAGTIEIRHP